MFAARLSLAHVADAMRADGDYKHRLKWAFEFFRGVGDDGADVAALIAEQPGLVGDRRFDAFLAAAAEYVAYHHGVAAPEWCYAPSRILDFGWHIAEYQQARRWAYSRTPGAFMVRGIYIEERELANV